MSSRKTVQRQPAADASRARAPAAAAARVARPRSLTAAWAAAIVAVLVVLFFHEVVVGGKTFVSPDATAPAGFVRIGEHSLYQQHVYPLWNPYVFLGMPSFASGTYNPLIYPPDWPVAILQKMLPLPDLTWMLIYYVLAGFSMFLLAREWGARAEAALLAGVAFLFAPNLIAVGSHGHGSQLVDSAYLPFMLWLATRWLRRGGTVHLAALALAGGFQMLRGHVQICFYTWLAIGVYALVEWVASLRTPERRAVTLRMVGIGCAAVLAVGLAGFYNLPLSDYAKYSIRGSSEGGGVGREYATQWSLAPYELPAAVVPGWVGFGGETYWGGMPFTDYPNVFVGIVVAVLALPAFLANGVPRATAILLAVLALLIAFGRHFPLYGLLYDHLPLFNKFRVPVMIVLLFQLAAALGLAWGWSTVLEEAGRDDARGRRLDRMMMVAAAVLIAALLLATAGRHALEGAYVATATQHGTTPGRPFPTELARAAFEAFASDLVRASLLGLAAIGLAWAARRRSLPHAIATAGVLLLLIIELWPVSGRVMLPTLGDPMQRDQALERDDVVEFLEKQGDAGSFRVLPFAEFQSNRLAGFGIASVGGYHAAKPRIAQDLIETQLMSRDRPPSFTWMRLLNVRFIVLPQPIDPAPPGWALVHQGSQVVYENALALPRATVVGHVAVVTPAKAILDSVAAGTHESSAWTFMTEDPRVALGSTLGATAHIRSYALNQVVVDVTTPGPALLRLADLWYPDWTARVDGRSAPVLRADYLLRAVPVPAGSHQVVFRFESRALRRGLLLSLASLAIVLVLFLIDPIAKRRRSRPQAA
jgi:hypothetical protein